MQLLITNDDGIGAAGLELLAKAAKTFGNVTIVAPKTEQSGVSHRLSFDGPLKRESNHNGGCQVDGTPGDCVRVALAQAPQKIDWVLSGVNDGSNLGVEIYYSGTVAAAREAALLGVPSAAFSQFRRYYQSPFDWSRQFDMVVEVLQWLFHQPKKAGTWTNINLPDAEGERETKLIQCAADMTPLPNTYTQTKNGLVPSFDYQKRPRKPEQDVAICFGGDVAISRHNVGELSISSH